MSYNMLKVVVEGSEWSQKIKNMLGFDFYHTFSYNNYYSNQGNNKPILFCFSEDSFEIVLPLILREIPGTKYYDLTSCYGYAGPIVNNKNIPNHVIVNFLNSFNNYLKNNNIITLFSRFHPSLQNEKYVLNLGLVDTLGKTVFIDLKVNQTLQKKQYRKGVKSDLNILKKEGYQIYEDINKEYLSVFTEIYNENMLRVDAKSEYYFNKVYYDTLLNSSDIDSRLYFVMKDNIKVATAIFVFTDSIIQYHLSGTRERFLKNSPIRLLIDYIREYGSIHGYSELHLGGGLGSNEDSLFQFKTGFSKQYHEFKVWKYVVNNDVYEKLNTERCFNLETNYFPKYRYTGN